MGIDMSHMQIHTENTTFNDNAAMIRNETSAAESDNKAATLRELREQLEKAAKAVDELEKAVNAKNKPKIRALLGNLTNGVMKDIITAVASDALLSWIRNLK